MHDSCSYTELPWSWQANFSVHGGESEASNLQLILGHAHLAALAFECLSFWLLFGIRRSTALLVGDKPI